MTATSPHLNFGNLVASEGRSERVGPQGTAGCPQAAPLHWGQGLPFPVPATCPLSAPSTPNPPCLCQPWPRPSPRAQRGFGAGGRGPGSVRSGPSPPPLRLSLSILPFFFTPTHKMVNGPATAGAVSQSAATTPLTGAVLGQ